MNSVTLAFWTLMMFVHGPVRWQWTEQTSNRIKNGSRFRFSLKVPIEVRWPPPIYGPIYEVLSQVKTYVKNEILSTVYSHRERVPQSEEFLLCSKETTLEVPGFADLGMGQASRRLRCGDQLWQRFRNVRSPWLCKVTSFRRLCFEAGRLEPNIYLSPPCMFSLSASNLRTSNACQFCQSPRLFYASLSQEPLEHLLTRMVYHSALSRFSS